MSKVLRIFFPSLFLWGMCLTLYILNEFPFEGASNFFPSLFLWGMCLTLYKLFVTKCHFGISISRRAASSAEWFFRYYIVVQK